MLEKQPVFVSEIMEKTSVNFIVGSEIPKDKFEKLAKIGGEVIRLTAPELLGTLHNWKQFHAKAGDSLSGWLVKDHYLLGTQADIWLSVYESSVENGETTTPELDSFAEEVSQAIGTDSEKTADSISSDRLSKIIASVAIFHSIEDLKRSEEFVLYTRGDPISKEFLIEVYKHYYGKDILEIKGSPKHGSKIFVIDSGGTGEVHVTEDEASHEGLYQYETRIDEIRQQVTTLEASELIRAEADVYGFNFYDNHSSQ